VALCAFVLIASGFLLNTLRQANKSFLFFYSTHSIDPKVAVEVHQLSESNEQIKQLVDLFFTTKARSMKMQLHHKNLHEVIDIFLESFLRDSSWLFAPSC